MKFLVIFNFSKYQNCTLIEFKNLNLNIFQKLNKRKYFVRNYNFNPYLIKFNSNKSNLLKNTLTLIGTRHI